MSRVRWPNPAADTPQALLGSRLKAETPAGVPPAPPFISLPISAVVQSIPPGRFLLSRVVAPPTADPVEPAPFVPFPRQGLPQKDFGLLVFDSRLIAGEPEPPPSVFLPIAGRSQPEGLIRFLTSRLKPETPAAAPATPVVFFPLSGVIQPPPISPRPSRLQFEPQVSPLPLLTRGRVPFDFAVARNVSRVKLEASPAASAIADYIPTWRPRRR